MISPADWHERRRTGLGGSDIVVVAGLSPYARGSHEVYLEKRGELEPGPPTQAMRLGQRLEELIADQYAEETGRRVVRVNRLLRHPRHQWAIANIDRRVVGEHRLLECKARRWMPRGTDLPADIEAQVQWYLGVIGYPVADVAILIGGTSLRIVELEADPGYFDDLLTIGAEFWKRVELGWPPAIDGSASASRYLATVYPRNVDDVLASPTPEIDELASELRVAEVAENEATGHVDSVKNAIKALLGETAGVQGAGYRITWKRQADYERTDWHGVADELHPEPALIDRHTTTVAGVRRFVATFDEVPA